MEQARGRLKDAEFYCDERTPADIGMHCQDVIETKGVGASWTMFAFLVRALSRV